MSNELTRTGNPIKAHGIWSPGIVVMRSVSFKAKAVIIALAFLIPMLGLLVWLLTGQTDQAMQERMNATREHVEIAHGVVAWAYSREASGELPREEAQKLAKSAVSKLRYNKEEYFWINDMRPYVVMHPIKPDLDGKDVLTNPFPSCPLSRGSRLGAGSLARASISTICVHRRQIGSTWWAAC